MSTCSEFSRFIHSPVTAMAHYTRLWANEWNSYIVGWAPEYGVSTKKFTVLYYSVVFNIKFILFLRARNSSRPALLCSLHCSSCSGNYGHCLCAPTAFPFNVLTKNSEDFHCTHILSYYFIFCCCWPVNSTCLVHSLSTLGPAWRVCNVCNVQYTEFYQKIILKWYIFFPYQTCKVQ